MTSIDLNSILFFLIKFSLPAIIIHYPGSSTHWPYTFNCTPVYLPWPQGVTVGLEGILAIHLKLYTSVLTLASGVTGGLEGNSTSLALRIVFSSKMAACDRLCPNGWNHDIRDCSYWSNNLFPTQIKMSHNIIFPQTILVFFMISDRLKLS